MASIVTWPTVYCLKGFVTNVPFSSFYSMLVDPIGIRVIWETGPLTNKTCTNFITGRRKYTVNATDWRRQTYLLSLEDLLWISPRWKHARLEYKGRPGTQIRCARRVASLPRAHSTLQTVPWRQNASSFAGSKASTLTPQATPFPRSFSGLIINYFFWPRNTPNSFHKCHKMNNIIETSTLILEGVLLFYSSKKAVYSTSQFYRFAACSTVSPSSSLPPKPFHFPAPKPRFFSPRRTRRWGTSRTSTSVSTFRSIGE